jgi:hypothetical protein
VGDGRKRRVLRGGGWNNNTAYCRSAARDNNDRNINDNNNGFRLCVCVSAASTHPGRSVFLARILWQANQAIHRREGWRTGK